MNPLFGAPAINLFSHGLGRLLAKSTSFRSNVLGKKLSDVGERVIYQAMKAGMEGKKLREGRLAILGTLSPGISSSVGMAHEIGSKARELGLESPEKFLGAITKLKTKIDNIKSISSKVIKYAPYASTVGPMALGGLVGSAATPKEGSKGTYAATGAALGAAGGLIGYKILAKSISKKIRDMGINSNKINKLHENAKGVVDMFSKVKNRKSGLVDKITRQLFSS